MSDCVDFLSLPEELQSHVLEFLGANDLVSVSATCTSLHRLADQPHLWQALCFKNFPALQNSDVDTEDDWRPLFQAAHRAAAVSELRSCICGICRRPSSATLSGDPHSNHEDTEGIVNTLDSRHTADIRESSYWSSTGNADAESSEHLTYKTPSLAIVKHASIDIYEAHWQRGSPIYAPKRVAFDFGPGNGSWSASAGPFECARTSERQRFSFGARGTLAVGGAMRVRLEGRTTRQDADDLFYTCVSLVLLAGVPVEGFTATADGATGRVRVSRQSSPRRSESPLPMYREPEKASEPRRRLLRLLHQAVAQGVPHQTLIEALGANFLPALGIDLGDQGVPGQ
eukprot:tig00000903_g5512.t1